MCGRVKRHFEQKDNKEKREGDGDRTGSMITMTIPLPLKHYYSVPWNGQRPSARPRLSHTIVPHATPYILYPIEYLHIPYKPYIAHTTPYPIAYHILQSTKHNTTDILQGTTPYTTEYKTISDSVSHHILQPQRILQVTIERQYYHGMPHLIIAYQTSLIRT